MAEFIGFWWEIVDAGLRRHDGWLFVNARYLTESKPLILVALGVTAAWALLGRYAHVRGQVAEVDYGPFKAKVVAT